MTYEEALEEFKAKHWPRFLRDRNDLYAVIADYNCELVIHNINNFSTPYPEVKDIRRGLTVEFLKNYKNWTDEEYFTYAVALTL